MTKHIPDRCPDCLKRVHNAAEAAAAREAAEAAEAQQISTPQAVFMGLVVIVIVMVGGIIPFLIWRMS